MNLYNKQVFRFYTLIRIDQCTYST